MTSKHEKPVPLTPDQVKAFEEILEVFNTPGWKHLAKRLEADSTVASDVRNCKDLAFTHGQLTVLDAIRRWPETWAALYDAAQAGDVEVEGDAFA